MNLSVSSSKLKVIGQSTVVHDHGMEIFALMHARNDMLRGETYLGKKQKIQIT